MKPQVKFPPACADFRAIEIWKHAARLAGGLNLRAGMCVDCLPDWKRKNMREGSCNNPHVKFRVDEDGFVEGYVPGKIEEAKCTPSPT